MFVRRPKLHIEKTMTEKIANIFGVASIFLMVFLIGFNWNNIPDIVPTHFNGSGKADGWGSKYTLLILPIVNIAAYTLFEFLERKPHLHNYPFRFTEENAAQFYAVSVNIMNLTKNITAMMFSYICYQIIESGIKGTSQLNITVMAIFMFLLVLVIVVGIFRLMKIK